MAKTTTSLDAVFTTASTNSYLEPLATPTPIAKFPASIIPDDVSSEIRELRGYALTTKTITEETVLTRPTGTLSYENRAMASATMSSTSEIGPTPTAVLVDSAGNKPNSYSADRALVLGCAIGGVLGLFLCALIVYCILSRYHWKKNRLKNKDEAEVIAEKFAKDRFGPRGNGTIVRSVQSLISDDSSETISGYKLDEEQSVSMAPLHQPLELNALPPTLAVLPRPDIEEPRRAPPPPPGARHNLSRQGALSSHGAHYSINTNKALPAIGHIPSPPVRPPIAAMPPHRSRETISWDPLPSAAHTRVNGVEIPMLEPRAAFQNTYQQRHLLSRPLSSGSSAKPAGLTGFLRPFFALNKKPRSTSSKDERETASSQSGASTLIAGSSVHDQDEDRGRITSPSPKFPTLDVEIRRTSVQSFEDLSYLATDFGFQTVEPLKINKAELVTELDSPQEKLLLSQETTDVEREGTASFIEPSILSSGVASLEALESHAHDRAVTDYYSAGESLRPSEKSISECLVDVNDRENNVQEDNAKVASVEEEIAQEGNSRNDHTEDLFKDFSGPASADASLVFDNTFERRRSLISGAIDSRGASRPAVPLRSERRSQYHWLGSRRQTADRMSRVSRMSRMSARSTQSRKRYSVQAQPSERSVSLSAQAPPPRPQRPLYSPFESFDFSTVQPAHIILPDSSTSGQAISRLELQMLSPLNEVDTPEPLPDMHSSEGAQRDPADLRNISVRSSTSSSRYGE